MTDTGDLKVDGTVSATALEFEENGTTKDVATELATLRSMIGSSGVSVAGMLVSSYTSRTIAMTMDSGTAPRTLYKPDPAYVQLFYELPNWERVISGGQVFETTEEWKVFTTSSSESGYIYSIEASMIPDSVFDEIAQDLVLSLDAAGSFSVTCNFYACKTSSGMFGKGTMKFRNGSFAGFTKNTCSGTLYSNESSSLEIYACTDPSSMAPLEE